ncbi:hypothetical protein GCM10009743_45670 [Kribbella swartbergensis]
MALVDSVADWAQVALNAGALLTGGVVWKMYFENLKATIGTKDAEVSLANKQADYWREKAEELEKRSPEAVERVLADRISIREQEIERLSSDREHSTQELGRIKEEVRVLNQTLEQTKGFLAVLKMEAPDARRPRLRRIHGVPKGPGGPGRGGRGGIPGGGLRRQRPTDDHGPLLHRGRVAGRAV